MLVTAPLTLSVSSQPSLSKSNQAAPKSGKGQDSQTAQSRARALIDEDTRAVVDVEIAALARQLRHEQIVIAVVVEVAGVHSHARLRVTFGAQRDARRAARCS